MSTNLYWVALRLLSDGRVLSFTGKNEYTRKHIVNVAGQNNINARNLNDATNQIVAKMNKSIKNRFDKNKYHPLFIHFCKKPTSKEIKRMQKQLNKGKFPLDAV